MNHVINQNVGIIAYVKKCKIERSLHFCIFVCMDERGRELKMLKLNSKRHVSNNNGSSLQQLYGMAEQHCCMKKCICHKNTLQPDIQVGFCCVCVLTR